MVWKKGQSGNLKGRPKGKTLKEFAREYLSSLPNDKKLEYLASLPKEIVWKMAEGNPSSESDFNIGGQTKNPVRVVILEDETIPETTESD